MKYLVLLLFPINSFCQISSSPHGTLIVAVICQDGILIAADSRGCYTQYNDVLKKEVPFACFDSTRKIFPLGNFQLAISGMLGIGNHFWDELIKKYNKARRPYKSIEATFNNFRHYLINTLKIRDSLMANSFYIVAGYENKIPVIIAADSINATHFRRGSNIGFPIVSKDCAKPYVVDKESQYYCKRVAQQIDSGFIFCGRNWELGIGGPVNALIIKSNNSIEPVKSFDFKKFKSVYEMEESIIQGETILIKSPTLDFDVIDALKRKHDKNN